MSHWLWPLSPDMSFREPDDREYCQCWTEIRGIQVRGALYHPGGGGASTGLSEPVQGQCRFGCSSSLSTLETHRNKSRQIHADLWWIYWELCKILPRSELRSTHYILFAIFVYVYFSHDDVIKWKHFPRYWPFVRVIHRSPVNSPLKGQWRGALMFSLICAWLKNRVNNREDGDLSRHRAHYGITVMRWQVQLVSQ